MNSWKEMYFSNKQYCVSLAYNFLTYIAGFFIGFAGFFNVKLKLFTTGRKATFKILKKSLNASDQVIWIHTASLGEYEQGLPVMERLRKEKPEHKIVLSFFSPSGYEVKKNTPAANIVVYLPLDTKSNVRKFLALVNPQLVLFVKYEIWPNYLAALKQREIPVILISALFRKNQSFFRWYGGFMRKSLKVFNHFFVQDENSIRLLKDIGLTNATRSGDTRFDRVSEILDQDNRLSFMTNFSRNAICFVAGSTWKEDEAILVPFLNKSSYPFKTIIAPHTISNAHCESLKKAISKKAIRYSEIENENLENYEVLILDTIGLLTKVYSYANIAYVGGGFATGLHNTLEPAVFGIPVIIGPQYQNFKEARELVDLHGIVSIKNLKEFEERLPTLFRSSENRMQAGKVNHNYIQENVGASVQIMSYIRTLL